MRIAFIADVHANLPALEAVIADAREHGATHLLCLGDTVGYGPQPVETLKRIREVASGVILGNHDAAAAELLDLTIFNHFAKETAERAILALDDEAKAYLRGLPNMLEVKNIACAHSCFEAPETYRYLETKEDAARSLEAMPGFTLLVVGHTHVPCLFVQESPSAPIRKLPPESTQLRPGQRYVVNPGSVGFPRTDNLTADYLIYDTLMRRLIFRSVTYDLVPYRLALVRNGYNPLNYWFLSPSARKRQTELALRNPAPAPASPFETNSPFRPLQPRRSPWWIFWACTLVLLAMVFTSTALLTHTEPPPEVISTEVYHNPANLLAPLTQWTLPEGALAPTETAQNYADLSPNPNQPRHLTLLSPLTAVPENCERLRFSFTTIAATKLGEKFNVVVEFIDQNGNRRRDREHSYKRSGPQSYTIRVPKEAEALQVQFNFEVRHPLKLLNPELEKDVE